jgi:Fe-S-cluster containining protein
MQGSPPGYSLCAWPAGDLLGGVEDSDDYRRFWAMPEAIRAELLAYYESVRAGAAPAREGPCLWLDPQTKRCRHYEHRPDVCREFPLGGLSCLGWRRDFGLPVPDGPPPASETLEDLMAGDLGISVEALDDPRAYAEALVRRECLTPEAEAELREALADPTWGQAPGD